MTMLDAAKKTSGHAEPTRAWEARIERRLGELATSGEHRVLALRDAIGEFVDTELAPRDEEIATLKKRVADLEHKFERKTAVDQQVDEIAARLEERQARRDRGKNGITDGNFLQSMGMVFAQERESARREFKTAVEEAKHAVETMLTRKLDAFEQRIVQRTDQRIIGRDGKDADPEAVARLVGERIEEPLHEFIRAQVDTKLTALEERLKSVPGRLPVVKIWRSESVTYEAEVVSYDGSLYQTRRDTAQAPGGSDWTCVARAGRDGRDGLTPNICGTYDAHKTYEQLDIVAMDGAAFIAKHYDPGICPGDGWQLLSRQGRVGRKGDKGEPGPRGIKGEPGASIVSWQIDRERYRASPLMSNGTVGPMLELRGLFEQFLIETAEH